MVLLPQSSPSVPGCPKGMARVTCPIEGGSVLIPLGPPLFS